MSVALPIVPLRVEDLRVFEDEPCFQDIRIAEALGFDRPRDIRPLIRRNLRKMEQRFGTVRCRTAALTTGNGAQTEVARARARIPILFDHL